MRNRIRYRTSSQGATLDAPGPFHHLTQPVSTNGTTQLGRPALVRSHAKWTKSFVVVRHPWRSPIFFRRIRDKYHGANFRGYRRVQASIPILETAGAFAAIVLINYFLSRSQSGFPGTQPHLFWILIVFIPLLYGSALGAFTGSVAFGLHLLFQFTQCLCPPDLTTPALMLLVAICVGELRQRSLNRISELSERVGYLDETVADLTSRLVVSEEACGFLQQRIRRETLTYERLNDFSRSLDALEEAQIWQGTADVAAEITGAELVSVWVYQQHGGVQMRATYPENAVSGITNDCFNTSPVLRQCLEYGKAVSIRDVGPSVASCELPNGPVLISAPLLAHNGDVTGFIIVEKIHFSHLIPAAVSSIEFLARWTSRSLQNSRLFRNLLDQQLKLAA